MLLKCNGLKSGLVVDPIEYPKWTRDRYGCMGIGVQIMTENKLTILDLMKLGFITVYNIQRIQKKLSEMLEKQLLYLEF